MKCPHCDFAAVFEAEKSVTIRPVIEGWKMDQLTNQLDLGVYVCLNCDGKVKVNMRSRILVPVDAPVIFDDAVAAILQKARENKEAPASPRVIETLRDRNYRRVSDLMTGREVVSLILEQRP